MLLIIAGPDFCYRSHISKEMGVCISKGVQFPPPNCRSCTLPANSTQQLLFNQLLLLNCALYNVALPVQYNRLKKIMLISAMIFLKINILGAILCDSSTDQYWYFHCLHQQWLICLFTNLLFVLLYIN